MNRGLRPYDRAAHLCPSIVFLLFFYDFAVGIVLHGNREVETEIRGALSFGHCLSFLSFMPLHGRTCAWASKI